MGFNSTFNSLNAELNPICHLLALLGAHPILHISRIRVKGLKGNNNQYEYHLSETGSVPILRLKVQVNTYSL
jgi:hypothetical protein